MQNVLRKEIFIFEGGLHSVEICIYDWYHCWCQVTNLSFSTLVVRWCNAGVKCYRCIGTCHRLLFDGPRSNVCSCLTRHQCLAVCSGLSWYTVSLKRKAVLFGRLLFVFHVNTRTGEHLSLLLFGLHLAVLAS